MLSYSYQDELGLLMTKEVIRMVSRIKLESQVSQKDHDNDHELNICVPQIKTNSQHQKLDIVKKAKRIFTWVLTFLEFKIYKSFNLTNS